jgi:very-short-patch-repair endonuclease
MLLDVPSLFVLSETALPKIAVAELGARIFELPRGERLTLIGIDREGVRNALKAEVGTRSALLLESAGGRTPEKIIDHLLDDLAALALERWPRWYGRDELAPAGFVDQIKADPLISAPWLRAAAKRAGSGNQPRFRKAAKGMEFVQLMHAIDPADPVLIATVDSVEPARAAPMIHALEWCAEQGASVVATFVTQPQTIAPFDRILYGALDVISKIEPVRARFIPAQSRAHHASAIEQQVEAALRDDAELAPLFVCNEIVSIGSLGSAPRVDLLWREGRVVVELDGPDHQEDSKFASDRHRDYELLVAGYLVLRITNNQVQTDLQRAIEKIRAVVRFRRSTEGIQS